MAIHFDPDVGFTADSTSVIRQKIVDDWTAVFNDEDATLNTSSESPAGQLIDSTAVLVTAKDSEFMFLSNQFNPLFASGIWQDAIGAIYFLTRKTATSTVVSCTCTGMAGTTIPQGSVIQTTDGINLASVGAATIGAGGTVDVEFACTEYGAIPIGSHTATKIITVIAGWDTVDNAQSGVLGSLVENRRDFEQRRYNSVSKNAHGSRAALEGAVYQVDGVLDCKVLENKTDASVTEKGVSLISHSVAVCVYGGNDTDIAETIYNKLDAGCGTNGGTTVSYTSEDGVVNTYKIVRPTPTPVYISVEINKTSTTPSTVANDIKNAIIADALGNDPNSGNTRCGLGQTIYASRFTVATVKTAGVSDLVSLYIGWSASPTGNSITTNANVEPVFDASNIEVTINE